MGRYREGRNHLADLLDQVWPRAFDIVRSEIVARYRRRASVAELVAVERRGKHRKVVIQRDQSRVFIGFCIPAVVKDSAVQVHISGLAGVPQFAVRARPWDGQVRTERGDRELASAEDYLRSHGFTTHGRHRSWDRVHPPEDFLDAPDVPARLLEHIAADVPPLIRSGILDHDVEAALSKVKGGPPRHRRLPDPV